MSDWYREGNKTLGYILIGGIIAGAINLASLLGYHITKGDLPHGHYTVSRYETNNKEANCIFINSNGKERPCTQRELEKILVMEK